jgi:hypothetical protein
MRRDEKLISCGGKARRHLGAETADTRDDALILLSVQF